MTALYFGRMKHNGLAQIFFLKWGRWKEGKNDWKFWWTNIKDKRGDREGGRTYIFEFGQYLFWFASRKKDKNNSSLGVYIFYIRFLEKLSVFNYSPLLYFCGTGGFMLSEKSLIHLSSVCLEIWGIV